MSERSKKPTLKTPPAPRAKVGPPVATAEVPPLAPTSRPDSKTLKPPMRDSAEDAKTHIFDSGNFRRTGPVEASDETSETYQRIDPNTLVPLNTPLPGQPKIQSRSMKDDGTFKQEVATPIKVMSMKTPGVGDAAPPQPNTPRRGVPQVKLRAMSEVAGHRHASPVNLGYLAPPRDSREVRARRTRDLVIWACICVMLASVFALGIWFLAK